MIHPYCGPTYAGLRIGLLGGSFNPAHDGHRAMSLHAMKRLGLDQVWWLVSPQNPLKSKIDMGTLAQRLASARAMARHPRIITTNIETQLDVRYTTDLLHELKRRFSRTHFVWLMGADNLQQIPRWHNWQDIFCSVPVAVFRRPAYAAGRKVGKAAQHFDAGWISAKQGKALADAKPPAWLVLDHPLNPLSATQIRKERSTWR